MTSLVKGFRSQSKPTKMDSGKALSVYDGRKWPVVAMTYYSYLPGLPRGLKWPVRLMNGSGDTVKVYCKSDNAIAVEEEAVYSCRFPCRYRMGFRLHHVHFLSTEVNYYEDLGGEDRDSERVGENRDPASEDRDPASDYVDPLIEDRAAVSEYDQDPISKDEDQDAVSECDDQDPVSKDEDQDAASECEDQDAGSECEDQDAVSECEDQDAVSECEDQDAVSECEDQDAVSEGEAQDPVSKGEAQDPVSECEDRDSVSECEDQDSVSECEDQDAGSECEDRDSVSECEDQDAGSECEDQDSVSECEDQDSVSECEDQDAVRECEDQDAVSECEDQNAVSECEDQDSVSECEDQDAVSECGDQDPVSKGEAQDPVSECEDRDPVREDRDPASENGDPLSEDPGTVSEGKDQDAGRDFAGEAQDPVIEVEDRDLIRKDEDPDTLSEDRGAVTEGKEHDPLSEDRDRFSQRDDRDIVRQCENDKVCQGENRHTDLESEDRNYESELDERNFISQDKIKDTVSKGTDADRIEISDEDFVSSHYSSDSSIVSIIKEKCTKIKLQCKKTSQRKFVNPLCQSKIKKREFTGKYDHSVSSESSKTSKEEAKSEKGDKSRKRIKRKHARKTDRDINCPAESEASDSSESSKTSNEEAKSEKDDKSRKRIKRKHARKTDRDINCAAESESSDSSESSKTSKEEAKYEKGDKSRKRIKRKHARKTDRDINCPAESQSSDSSKSSKTSNEEAKSEKEDKSRKRIKRKHARKTDRDINCAAESESSDSSESSKTSKEEAKYEKGDKSRKRIKRKHARKTDRDINCPAESESSDSSESSKTSKEEAKSEKDDKSRKRIKRNHARKPDSDINCTAESESNDSSESSKTSKEKAKYENSDKSRKRIKRKHARKPDRDINCTAESESSDSSESSKTSKEEAKSGKGDKSRKRIKRKHARKPDRDINCTAESESSDSSEKRPSSKFVRSDINNKEIYVRKLLTSSHTASGKKKASDRVWNQSHSCLFCKKVISNIAKHLRKHRNRPEITEILAVSSQLGPKNKKTRAMWDIVRNKGDHEQNMRVLNDGKGEFIVGRRHKGKFDVSHYGPCPECYVWLKLDTSLVKHQNVCPCRILETSKPVNVGKRELFIMSLQVSGKISSHASKALQNEVFSIMTLDNVSEIAQTDKLIISLGNMWLLKNAGNLLKRKYYTSSHMRGAARLLMNVRQLAGMPAASYTELLVPSHFDNFVKGALITASPEIDDDEDLKFPSTALKIGYDLKRLVGAKWGIALRERDSGAEEDCKKFLKLMKFEWSVRVSKQALITLQTRKFNAEKSLPEPDDLVKLNKHIKDELKNLNLKDQSYQTWRRAEVLAQARLLVFNKRRSGEVDVIRVKDYLRRKSGVSTLDKAMRDKLSPVEVKLLESHDLMEVRGKFGRGVPVIIPADLRKVLAYLSNADVRLASGVLNTNHYLFPNKANGVIRAYDSLKLMCEEAALKQPERITSVCLRKYMATVSQVFDLNVHQLEWVSNHLGHSVDIHKIHYRQTSGVIERVDMSKLMLLQEYNMTAKFAGKSLAEIQFPDLVFSQDNRHEDTVCTDDGPATDEGVSSKLDETCVDDNYQPDDENYQPDESKDETFDEYDFLEDDGEQEVSKKRKAISTRQKWTKEELAEVQMYFKEHLSSKTTPGRQDCVRAIDKSKANNGTLQRRSWETLKKKVWNLIQKSK